eukprot:CAMPEP_0194270016 /NCGR_PEP_ID=MMETSP0169-20130528/4090_1 /TAXON_ID=218684 /ORGANISM="Corethron pennatum, Strain L29A3" /LENGTH=170 /DNA_ID=CAMNT_0039011907 /DNA_START=105 /DNA_END=614 /DNA_ORIENTATION=-
MIVILKKRFVSGEKGEVDNGEVIDPFAQTEQPQSNLCTAENSPKNYEQNLYTTRYTNQDSVRKDVESAQAPTPTTEEISIEISEITNTLHDTIAAPDYSHYFSCTSNSFVTPPKAYSKVESKCGQNHDVEGGSIFATEKTNSPANTIVVSDNKADSIVILGKRVTITRDK